MNVGVYVPMWIQMQGAPWFLVNCRIQTTSGAVSICSLKSVQFDSVVGV